MFWNGEVFTLGVVVRTPMVRVVSCEYRNLERRLKERSRSRPGDEVFTVPPRVTRYLGERVSSGMFTGLDLLSAFCLALIFGCGMMDGMRF
jgi:hypothetical protein